MSMVNISKAAKLAGISRTHLYRKYINTGMISVSKDETGKSFIDTSELIRVFSKLHTGKTKVAEGDSDITSSASEIVLLEKIKGLEALLKAKEEELEGYREREKYLYHLIEDKPKKRRWFGFKF